jgi:hypothetical protein
MVVERFTARYSTPSEWNEKWTPFQTPLPSAVVACGQPATGVGADAKPGVVCRSESLAPRRYSPAPSTVNSTTLPGEADAPGLPGVAGLAPVEAGAVAVDVLPMGATYLVLAPHPDSTSSAAMAVTATTTRFTRSVHRTAAAQTSVRTATSASNGGQYRCGVITG